MGVLILKNITAEGPGTIENFLKKKDISYRIVEMGEGSSYYELALYKLGWSFYKQEMYQDGLHRFVALLDHKVGDMVEAETPAGKIKLKILKIE